MTGEKCDKGSEPEVILNHLLHNLLKLENEDCPILEYAFYEKSFDPDSEKETLMQKTPHLKSHGGKSSEINAGNTT